MCDMLWAGTETLTTLASTRVVKTRKVSAKRAVFKKNIPGIANTSDFLSPSENKGRYGWCQADSRAGLLRPRSLTSFGMTNALDCHSERRREESFWLLERAPT